PAAAELIVQCHAHDWDDPGKPATAWDDKAARDALVSALVNDANRIVDGLREAKLEQPAAQAVALLALVAGQDVEPAEGAYGTGEARAALGDAGHTAVIKPASLRPAVEGGFSTDDFTVDETAGTVTCPNGITRTMTRHRRVVFGVACRGCPLRRRCTTAQD